MGNVHSGVGLGRATKKRGKKLGHLFDHSHVGAGRSLHKHHPSIAKFFQEAGAVIGVPAAAYYGGPLGAAMAVCVTYAATEPGLRIGRRRARRAAEEAARQQHNNLYGQQQQADAEFASASAAHAAAGDENQQQQEFFDAQLDRFIDFLLESDAATRELFAAFFVAQAEVFHEVDPSSEPLDISEVVAILRDVLPSYDRAARSLYEEAQENPAEDGMERLMSNIRGYFEFRNIDFSSSPTPGA